MITKGAYHLHQSSQGITLSKYHLESSIAYWLTIKANTKGKWETILSLYNKLLIIEYSPIAALNRTYALSKAVGKTVAITEALKLNLSDNPFYFSLLGELYKGLDNIKAKQNFQKAFSLAKTKADQQTIQKQFHRL